MLEALNLGTVQALSGLLEPQADLVVGRDRRAGALGDRHRVADVVAMAVRDQDQVGRHLLGLGRRLGVARQERVDQDRSAHRSPAAARNAPAIVREWT